MPHVWMRVRTWALVVSLCVGGYALAVAQPAPKPAATPAPESPLLVEPKTPFELFDAAVLTENLNRSQLTKGYLAKLLQSNPSDQVLTELRSKHGPAIFLAMSRNPQLQPEGTQLLERVTAAFKRHGEDPAYLDELIGNLFGSPEDRDTAQLTLRNAGPAVAPRLLQHIGDPRPKEEANVLVRALVDLGEPVVPVLLGGLESSNDSLQNGAIQALGLLGSRQAVPYLLEPAFNDRRPAGIRDSARRALARILGIPADRGEGASSVGAAAELRKTVRDCLCGDASRPATGEIIELWTWDEQKKSVVRNQLSPRSASLYKGLRLARQALELSPENRDSQVLFLALDFAWDAQGNPGHADVRVGPGTPYNLALAAGPEVVSDTLALGLKCGNPAVATGALHAMVGVGARHELFGSREPRSPLLAALNFPNPDVQYAAAVAILQMNPESRFRGCDRIVEVLARAISGTQSPLAVVIDVNHERANDVAGLFTQIGFEAVPTYTGKSGFEVVTERANVALVVVNVNVIRWPLSQTLSNLRADARSAHVPIVIYGPESVRAEIRGALTRYRQIEFLADSATQQHVELQLQDFLKRALAAADAPADRSARVADAVAWLASIARGNRTDVFSLVKAESPLMTITMDRSLYANAMDALSAIPTATTQRHFEQLAVSERIDVPIRVAAARHLAAHIHRFGLLLTSGEAAGLENAWRFAQNADVVTALTAAVGSLKPNARRVGDLLQNSALPSKPTP